MAIAGKDVEISLWDMERTFAAGPKIAQRNGVSPSADGKTKKRKKDQLEEGEIWRAKHVSICSLLSPSWRLSNMPDLLLSTSYQTTTYHYKHQSTTYHSVSSLTAPPIPPTLSSPPERNQGMSGNTTRVSGNTLQIGRSRVRVGSSRSKRVSMRSECLACRLSTAIRYANAQHLSFPLSELFFVDASSQFGSLDVRTGRTLYTYSKQTATAYDVLPLPSAGPVSSSVGSKDRVGMLSLSSDATVRLHTVSAPPKEAKGNVTKGEILGMIGGVGIGKIAYVGTTDIPSEENEEGRQDSEEDGASEDDEDGEENVWNDLAVVHGDEDESDEDDSESSEDEAEALKVKRKKTDGKAVASSAPKRTRR